jgi:hypothetical protein
MRTELQNEIAAAIQQLSIPTTDFRPLPFTTDWHKLEEQIYQRFCKINGKSRPIWLWDSFKRGYQGIDLNVHLHIMLNQLIPNTEIIWFMASDGNNFSFYEGKIEAIQSIIGETSFELDEYYLISKKHEWLFCVNHHDILIGTGDFAIKQIRALAERQPQLVIKAYPA